MNTNSKSALLEQVLGAKSKVAVLRTLFYSKLGDSGSGLAKRTGTGLFAVQKTLATLESIGLVEVARGAVENRYRLNAEHYLVANGLQALFEGERRMQKTLATELSSLLEQKVIAAGLFGSFARGTAGAGSDIDLFVVVQTVQDREAVSRILSDAQASLTLRYGLPLQAVIFERRRLIQGISKGQTLLDDVAADWQQVAGLTHRELKKSLGPAQSKRAR